MYSPLSPPRSWLSRAPPAWLQALILARKLGWRLELADVSVESLFPPHLGPAEMALPAFLERGLATLDHSMAQRCEEARKEGTVLRYAATVEGNRSALGGRGSYAIRRRSPSCSCFAFPARENLKQPSQRSHTLTARLSGYGTSACKGEPSLTRGWCSALFAALQRLPPLFFCSCRVGVVAVSPESPLGRLKGSDNLVRPPQTMASEARPAACVPTLLPCTRAFFSSLLGAASSCRG
jgi:hypothetical protein